MSGNKVLPDTNAVGLYLDDRKFATKYLYPDLVVSNFGYYPIGVFK